MDAVQALYNALGIDINVTTGDVWGLACFIFILLAGLSFLLRKTSRAPSDLGMDSELPENEEAKIDLQPIESLKTLSFSERLSKGLSRTRNEVWGKLTAIIKQNKLNDEQIEEIEEILYSADIGPKMANSLIAQLEEKVGEQITEKDLKDFLYQSILEKMQSVHEQVDRDLYQFDKNKDHQTKVIMIVGVNGAGKTTSIGKLATKLTQQGAKVVVGACDTFRAAAVDQLQVWCDRAGATMIRAKEGSDPSGVGYEALATAQKMRADYCLLDTAGRLHTKENLMEELKKSRRVLSKLDVNAPHQVLLVIDAVTGQNALRQAQEFNKALGVTGLIFTKCDGSSKAGSAISIVDELKAPIVYIGVGESVEDLQVFDLKEYLQALLGHSMEESV